MKLYTREGNWDLVGNNIPVFFIQDAIKFPDVIHAAKQEPDRHSAAEFIGQCSQLQHWARQQVGVPS